MCLVEDMINTLDDCDLLEKVLNMTNVRAHNDVTVSIKVQQFRSRYAKFVYYFRLRRPWTSTFFRPASRTVGFSLQLKSSCHVITFLCLRSLQNHDKVIPSCFFFPTAAKSGLAMSCFSLLCRSPEEGKMSFVVQFKIFYGDNFKRCKMHRMKKERFELITYQEFACEVLQTTKWQHVISVLQTPESQKCYHVTRIFEPQTKTNGP